MEPDPYKFKVHPENHQPSVVCDFSKIYNPTDMYVTYTITMPNHTRIRKPLERTEVIGENYCI